MLDAEIIFCGLSKNNLESLKKNIEFVMFYKQKSKFHNINVLLVDSNSDDGSKEYLTEISHLNNFINVIHKDDISSIDSRVERIKICRNLCLNFINQHYKKKLLVYIPCDMDFYLFSKTSFNQLDTLVSKVIKDNTKSAIFPASEPYYYDIFALRAPGWLNINSQLIVSRLKKYFKFGSFIYNYFFIFRYQLSPEKIKSKKYSLISAFGGIGIYNISDLDLNQQRYKVNDKDKDWYSEHLYFNRHFENLEINVNWIVEAPKEHVMFKSYDFNKKLKYIIKSFKEDFKNILRN